MLRAIGASIFNKIKDKNILFEGYTDYKLFHKFNNRDFSQYGTFYLCGITDVKKIIPMVILTNTKFVIVADSDQASNDKFKDFKKNFPDYENNWLGYGVSDKGIITLEDFYRKEYVKNIIKNDNSNLYEFEWNEEKSAISNIENYVSLIIKGGNKKTKKDKIQEIKNKLVESAEKKDIQKSYFNFLKCLEDKLQSL